MTESAPVPLGAGSRGGRTAVEFEADVEVLTRKHEADGVVSLELGALDGEALPSWSPGAHIDVLLPDGVSRQYSLCGSVGDPSWRVGVLREPESRGGSRWIHEHAHVGTRLRVRGPRNHFPLLESPRYLFVAGGIGITPLIPMIAEADAAGADWRLHYGGRRHDSMAFLDDLAGYGDRVVVQPEDRVGMLDLPGILEPPDPETLVYCCGPTGLIDAVEHQCQNWRAGSVHVERFTNEIRSADDNEEIEVELRSSGVTLSVPPELSILEAVENAGVNVLKSCSEGTCGTCETGVLEGEVDHRDAVLSEEERAENDTMMICVSRARNGRLVLDL